MLPEKIDGIVTFEVLDALSDVLLTVRRLEVPDTPASALHVLEGGPVPADQLADPVQHREGHVHSRAGRGGVVGDLDHVPEPIEVEAGDGGSAHDGLQCPDTARIWLAHRWGTYAKHRIPLDG